MNKEFVINSICKNARYLQVCKRVTKTSIIADDLFQEIVLILLNKDEQFLVDLYNRNELIVYFTSLANSLYRPGSKTSQFMRKHYGIIEVNSIRVETDIECNFDNYKCDIIDYVYKDIEKPRKHKAEAYQQNLLNAILKEGSINKIVIKTGITYRSIKQTLFEYKQRLENERSTI